jgi:hypothetical protein
MYLDHRIAVVVPCWNEHVLIRRVIETMPDTVDRMFVIDDQSTDDTANVVQEYVDKAPERIVLLRHTENQGVGGAIASGYKAALAERFDITVVMAGDAQMDPAELPAIVEPVARGECDYTKGNRLFSGEAWDMIPRVRYLGNAMLSLLTKIASGYWHVADSQSGYTAISLKALETIDWDQMYKRYGQPNDLLGETRDRPRLLPPRRRLEPGHERPAPDHGRTTARPAIHARSAWKPGTDHVCFPRTEVWSPVTSDRRRITGKRQRVPPSAHEARDSNGFRFCPPCRRKPKGALVDGLIPGSAVRFGRSRAAVY